jgi:MGT family glycosyltransferase
MKVLVISTPVTGHLNPLLAIARSLLENGHEVTIMTGYALRDRVEASGATYRAFPPHADIALSELREIALELAEIEPGPKWLHWGLKRYLVDRARGQHDGLQQAIREWVPDIILGDEMVFGVLPMLLGSDEGRPPVVLCGTSVFHSSRADDAPNFLGLPYATTAAERDRYAAIAKEYDEVVNQPIDHQMNELLTELNVRPLDMMIFDSIFKHVDAYLQLTVPSFEFPRKLPLNIHFVGTPPIVPNQAPLPRWANELDGSRKVVLVTQGTLANHNFGLLVAPTLAALADEEDVLIMVTTGGQPTDMIPGTIPSNARVASYLPFEWALEKADVFVTNGGYGSVNQALSYGLPIVSAGLTEDKADVNARIAWSGVGIDLATNQPTPQALRKAVRAVLDQPNYRARAKAIAAEYAAIDTGAEVIRIISELVSGTAAGSFDDDLAVS